MLIKDLFDSTIAVLGPQYRQTAWVEGLVMDFALGFLLLVLKWDAETSRGGISIAPLTSFILYLIGSGTPFGPVTQFLVRAGWISLANTCRALWWLLTPFRGAFIRSLPLLCGIVVVISHVVAAGVAAVAGSIFVYITFSLSMCIAGAWMGVYIEVIQSFCLYVKRKRDPLAVRREHVLQQLSSLVMREGEKHDVPARPYVISASAKLPQKQVVSAQAYWFRLLRHGDLQQLYKACRYLQYAHVTRGALDALRLRGALSPPFPPLEASLSRLYTLLQREYRHKYNPPACLTDRALYIMRFLAGPLVQYCLPFAFLRHLSRPLQRDDVACLLLTPFFLPPLHSQCYNIGSYDDYYAWYEYVLPPLGFHAFLVDLAETLLAASVNGCQERDLPSVLEYVLEKGWAEREEEEVQRLLPETILDGILLWKEVKTEKEAKRRKKQGKE